MIFYEIDKKMKLYYFQLVFIIILSINYSTQQVLSLKKHETEHFPIKTGGWKDLIGVTVGCPNGGVLKNFILRKNTTHFWYEYQCYSSLKSSSDEGEPIIKTQVLIFLYEYKVPTIKDSISILDTFHIPCSIDYGVTSFYIYTDNSIRSRTNSKMLKPIYTTQYKFVTDKVTAPANTMDGLANILVGSTDVEDDINIAYVLRGFKIIVDTSKSKENPTVSYKYGISVLRNMKAVKEKYKEGFKNLRNGNTQKI